MITYKWKLEDIKKIEKNNYKVFSCFSCGGGSCMGYKLAGYNLIGNCEIDNKINEMYLKNFNVKYNFNIPIQELVNKEKLPEELYNLDILDGSPPCSTFSMAGEREKNWGKAKRFREGQAEQILDDLFFDFIKLAKRLQPKIVIAENVKGMLGGKAKGYINKIIKDFNEANYEVQLFLLNAATMGVPQKRERVFFICRRKDLKLNKIELNFNEKPILYKEFADINYKKINENTLTYKRWLKRNEKDRTMGDTVKRTENGKISGITHCYIKKNEVLPTLVSAGGYFRYDVPGYLSDLDTIHGQSFPEDYNFNGQSVEYVCGMSVPPIMMMKIAEQVKIQLLDKIK